MHTVILPAEDFCNPPVSRVRVVITLSFYFNYRWCWVWVAKDFRALSPFDSMALCWNTLGRVTSNILNYFLKFSFLCPFHESMGWLCFFSPFLVILSSQLKYPACFSKINYPHFCIVLLWLSFCGSLSQFSLANPQDHRLPSYERKKLFFSSFKSKFEGHNSRTDRIMARSRVA